MSFALIANVAAGSTDSISVTTAAINTTGADLIVLEVSDYLLDSPSTISDSKGNTWTTLTTYDSGQFNRSRLMYVKNPTVGSGHTFTATTTTGYPSIAVQAWSGAHLTSPFDQQNGSGFFAATSIQPGSITPTENNELVVTGVGSLIVGAVSVNGGFTISDQVDYSPGVHFAVALAHLVQTTAAAANPTWSWSGAAQGATGIASFKAAAAADTLFAQALM